MCRRFESCRGRQRSALGEPAGLTLAAGQTGTLVDDLRELLELHRAEAFPSSVVRGVDFGGVDPVLIDVDIYGWALTTSEGGSLTPVETARLRRARAELDRSLDSFPDHARLYYERLVDIADRALGELQRRSS